MKVQALGTFKTYSGSNEEEPQSLSNGIYVRQNLSSWKFTQVKGLNDLFGEL